uniref:Uncharacterized protein n=1 Tax=Phasianus colchicus TaxID=9054 RepID=A0A669PMF2_PHACC
LSPRRGPEQSREAALRGPAGRSGRGRAVKQPSQSPACLFQRGAQQTRTLCIASSCGARTCRALGSEGRGDAQRAALRARLLTGALLNETQTRGPPPPSQLAFLSFPPFSSPLLSRRDP